MIAVLAALLLAAPGPLAAAAPPPPPSAAAPLPPRSPEVPLPPPPPARHGGRLGGEWPEKASGKRVSLTHKASVDEALEKIAGAAGWNLVANTGREGDRPLVLTLRDAPVEEALRAVLEGTSLVATRHGDSVTVAPGAVARLEAPVLSGFERPSGKKVSADFADTPVDEAVRQIADAAGLSVVLPPGLRGAVTAHFKDAPVEEALKAVLAQAGLSAAKEGSILTVSRGAGPSLVIRGGKRSLEFQIDGEEVAAAAEEAAREVQGEVAGAKREIARAGRRDRAQDRVVSGDVTVGPGERVRTVVAIRGSIRLEAGAQAKEVVAILGSVELGPGAEVEESAVAIGGDLHVSPGARVGKDAVSVGGELVIDPGGEVEGEETSVSLPGVGGLLLGAKQEEKHSPLRGALNALARFALFFALGLLLLMFSPRRLDVVAGALKNDPLKVLLVGLLGTAALPVLAVLLAVTIIGIPLIAVEVLAVLVAGVLGFTALSLLVGRGLPFKPERGAAVIQLAIGTALVVALTAIPVVGCMAWVAGWLFVFGAVLRSRFGQPLAGPLPTTPAPPPAPAG